MHPVTRLARVHQQLRSFQELHAFDLTELAAAVEQAGQSGLAGKLRVLQAVQSDELALVIDELADLRSDFDARMRPTPATDPAAPADSLDAEGAQESPIESVRGAPPDDPAASSPKRARWRAEMARRAAQPVSRRAIFTGPLGSRD